MVAGGGVEENILNAELKLRLDGPEPTTYLRRLSDGSVLPSEFVIAVQVQYFKMFGGVDMKL